MTPEQAEQELGPRGSLKVNADNLATLKKWLTSHGAPGTYAARIPYWLAMKCYNDTTNAALSEYIQRGKMFVGKQKDEIEHGKAFMAKAQESTTKEIKTIEDLEESEAAGQVLKNMQRTQARIDAHDAAKMEHAQVRATNTETHIESIQQAYPALNKEKSSSSEAGQVLANLVGPYLGRTVMQEVMAKVDAALANVQITRIELQRQDGTIHVEDGHVHPQFKTLLQACASRMTDGFHPNIMVSGPTGSGKTHACKQAAKALGLGFYTNGALSMDHQVVGFIDANGTYRPTAFRKAFNKAALYLFDEFDSSDNSCLLALAGPLANGVGSFPDAMIERHKDSVIICAGNTWGHGATSDFVGRNRIDGAVRSRFPVRISWGYDEDLETAICGNAKWSVHVQRARMKAREAGLKVIIDPRMSMAGAALIAQGMDFTAAAQLTYLADLSNEQRKIVEG